METVNKVDLVKKLVLDFNRKTDTEKLAILLTIPKVLNTSEVSESDLQFLYEEVGFTFANKLLKSDQVPENCSELSFKAVSLSILKCFSHIPSLAESQGMLGNVDAFNKILKIALSGHKTLNNDEMNAVVADCLEIMLNMACTPNGCQLLISNNNFLVLEELIAEFFHGWELAMDVLKVLIRGRSSHLEPIMQSLPSFLTSLCQKVFSTPPRTEVFTVVKHLNEMCGGFDQENATLLDKEKFWPTLVDGLFGMLQSKINQNERDLALSLSIKTVSHLGIRWFIKKSVFKKFYLLILHLSAVEIQLSVYGEAEKKSLKKLPLLAECCNLVEKSIQHCCTINKYSSGESKDEIEEVIFEVIEQVLKFFDDFSIGSFERGDVTNHTGMLFRLVCAYVSYQEYALDDDILIRLPAFINIISVLYKDLLKGQILSLEQRSCSCKVQQNINHKSLKEIKSGNHNNSVDDHHENAETCDSFSHDDFCLLNLFLPGLENLTHLSEARETLMENSTLDMLLDYFHVLCYREVDKIGSLAEDVEEDSARSISHMSSGTSLNLICDIFCNFVYPENEMCEEVVFEEICCSFIHQIIDTKLNFLHGDENLELLLNLFTLCLILLQKTSLITGINRSCLDLFVSSLQSTAERLKFIPCDPLVVEMFWKERDSCCKKIERLSYI